MAKIYRLCLILCLSLGALAVLQLAVTPAAVRAEIEPPASHPAFQPAIPQQQVVTVTKILTPSKDNTLYEDATGSGSNGVGDYLFVGRTNQSSDSLRRAVIAFDLAANLPPAATVVSASLELHLSTAADSTPHLISLYRLTTDWGEGDSEAPGQEGAPAPAAVGDATWTHAVTPTTPWLTPGGDFTTTVSAQTSVGNINGDYTWATTPTLVADVQDWLNNPANNFGWLVLGNETTNKTARRFNSRDNTEVSTQPRLTVQYTLTLSETLYLPLLLREVGID
jgi:hypothetical protein